MKYRFEGKEKLLALGKYPDVSLKEARERRERSQEIPSSLSDSKLPGSLISRSRTN